MSSKKLFIANKNYSSWSMRPWIAMKVKQIEFEESFQQFDEQNQHKHFQDFSPTGKVPVLMEGNLVVWDSLAILEYLADVHADKNLWPRDLKQRAQARAIANEMHSGFMGLRSECPMNMRRPIEKLSFSLAVVKDIKRIEDQQAILVEMQSFAFSEEEKFYYANSFLCLDDFHACKIAFQEHFDKQPEETIQ